VGARLIRVEGARLIRVEARHGPGYTRVDPGARPLIRVEGARLIRVDPGARLIRVEGPGPG
jgi:hypothetical protein